MKYLIFIIIFLNIISLNAEREWVLKKPRFEKEDLSSLTCADSNNCYVFSYEYGSSFIYKSINKGDTWEVIYKKNHFEIQDSIYELGHGFVLDNSYIYHDYIFRVILEKSTDGGLTFKRISFGDISSDEDDSFWELKMYDRKVGAGVTNNHIIVTGDNWETYSVREITWSKLPGDLLFFLDSNNLVLTKQFRIGHEFLKYNIAKNEWSEYSKGEEYPDGYEKKKNMYNVYFVNDSVGYAAGDQDTIQNDFAKDVIWKTTNRGKTWEVILDRLNQPWFGVTKIACENEEHIIAVGSWGKILESTDAGKTWNLIPWPYGEKSIGYDIAFAGQYPLISSWQFGIHRLETTLGSDAVLLDQERVKVRQTDSKLLISINDVSYSKYKIQVFDMRGNLLISQELNSGVGHLYEPVMIDKLGSGAYVYRVFTDVELVFSGKFVRSE